MRSRFETPEAYEESLANCGNCEARRLASDLFFDEQAEQYVCDRECFDEWHSDNADEVGDYYWRMNIDY